MGRCTNCKVTIPGVRVSAVRRRRCDVGYRLCVLSEMRRPDGSPNLRVRVLAALVVVGLLLLTAPLILLPLVRYLAGSAF